MHIEFPAKPEESPKARQVILSPAQSDLTCLKKLDSPLHKFCIDKLKLSQDHLKLWNVGTSERGLTTFVYQTLSGRFINIVFIEYVNSNEDCKRNKEKTPFSLKAKSGSKYELCLFGEHLLTSKTVCLVESEKTAIIASFFYPQFDWLATGGNNKLTDSKIEVLFNKEILYINDSDKAGRNNSTIEKLRAYKQNFKVVNLFPDRSDGYDLADAIINGLTPEIKPFLEYPVEPVAQKVISNNAEETPKEKNVSELERVERFISDRYDIRFNEISNEVEFKVKGCDGLFETLNENNLYRVLQKNFINFSLNKLISLLSSDFVTKYNPIQNYFENLPNWGIEKDEDHILKLTEFVPVKDKERFKMQLKKMLVRCVACSLTSVFNKQAFILVHDMQNSGKSTFCRWLCPPALSPYIAENINMDKDSLIALTENFIINMDELANMSRVEINALKAFMSKDVVKVRLPYGKRAVMMPRRANFFGSTNKDEFLSDETGSVRWLCFELTGKLDFSYKEKIDINNIWAQAYALFKGGFKYELSPDEIAENEKSNDQYRITTTEQELIQATFIPSGKDKPGATFNNATQIKSILETSNPGARLNTINIGKALKILGFKQEQFFNGNYQTKGYYTNYKA
ncbi:MAG TPA: VapE domain-containing protein [Bacteroidia bacterium]|nr:VapE domain-containing protein [Bacteroidia bacterium]